MGARKMRSRGRTVAIAIAATAAVIAIPTLASAHIERASYWPAPGGESVDGVQAGGQVPAVRDLFTALNKKATGDTRVVCQGKPPKKKGKKGKKLSRKAKKKFNKKIKKNPSMKALHQSIKSARKSGYVLRPSQPPIQVGKKKAKRLSKFNRKLLMKCRYDSIQDAVTDSGNNDRVVVMPGTYTEPESRAKLTNDPACAGLKETNDRGNTGAVSYRYQFQCPNDQNLIAVIGRDPGGIPPQPPLFNRRGIPDIGPCIRCNLQIEGSGISPDDVIVEAGDAGSGDDGPANPAKDVGIRADRADGFVARNLKVRHAKEHGFYIIETDGYLIEDFKVFHNEDYGVLTFTSDHGVMRDCDAAASGDSSLYPGASPETGEQTTESARRYNTEIAFCDLHHSAAGYSGTDGNGVHFHDNHVYDNANGFTTDVFTAAGHPGFPQDSALLENNEFYSNNFNPYLPRCPGKTKPGPHGPSQGCSDIDPTVPMPVGTGMWIAGGNANIVRNNRFYNNWRRGVMLFSVPDAFVCNDPQEQVPGCDVTQVNTSFRNQFHGNKMGQAPNGVADPNGLDFWWDQQGVTLSPNNTANCWFNNTGPDGTAASIDSIPPSNGPAAIPPNKLPDDCNNSTAPAGGPQQALELLTCSSAPQGDATQCNWFATPPEQ
jgi:Right handed beta helix region